MRREITFRRQPLARSEQSSRWRTAQQAATPTPSGRRPAHRQRPPQARARRQLRNRARQTLPLLRSRRLSLRLTSWIAGSPTARCPASCGAPTPTPATPLLLWFAPLIFIGGQAKAGGRGLLLAGAAHRGPADLGRSKGAQPQYARPESDAGALVPFELQCVEQGGSDELDICCCRTSCTTC